MEEELWHHDQLWVFIPGDPSLLTLRGALRWIWSLIGALTPGLGNLPVMTAALQLLLLLLSQRRGKIMVFDSSREGRMLCIPNGEERLQSKY